MRVLFYSSYHATPHLETELEIAKQLMEEGHEVYFLRCLSQLKKCFANPKHTYFGCKVCISKISNGYKSIGIPNKNIITFPKADIDIHTICNPHEIKTIYDLKKITYKGWDLGMAVASSLVSAVRDHSPDTNYHKDFIKKGIETAAFVYDAGIKLLEDIKPDLVYLFNGRFLEVRPLMRLCEQKSIRFYTHERGGQLGKYLLRENSIPHSLIAAKIEIEKLWADGGEEKEKIGKNFFEDRRNRVVHNGYAFTKNQQYNKLPENFDKSRTNISIFNSSMDEYEGIAEHKSSIYRNDNEGIEKILLHFKNDKTKHFYLRVHPNLKNLNNTQIKEIEAIAANHKNITVIRAEEDIDTYALIDNSDKVVVFGSTAGIEAVYWNKPVILLSRAFYDSLNCVYKPSSHEETISLMDDNNLKPLNQSEALKFGYWILCRGIPFKDYQPLSVRKGNFLGKPLMPHTFWRMMYIIENKISKA